MKKFLCLIFATILFFTFNSCVFAKSELKDIVDTKYEVAVEALESLNIINGFEDKTYRPYDNVTRAQMAKMLVASLNLNEAADYAKNNSHFSDVEGHWAIGYINIAEVENLIKGYPDGTFLPNKEVTYAEAVTMVVRALGYGNVVEARGTYPTNYMNKANELGLLEGIDANKYTDKLERGDVATLLWNMLNTKMWLPNGESDENGISYGKSNEIMLTIKFSSYKVVENGQFKDYSVTYDNEEGIIVKLLLVDENNEELNLEYKENDFYNFISKEKVNFIYNKYQNKLLNLTSTQKGKKLSGYCKDFKDEKFYNDLIEDYNDNDYLVFFVYNNKVTLLKSIDLYDEYIEKIENRSNGIKVNDKLIRYPNEELVLINGERKTIENLKVGVVYTKVDDSFYIVSEDILRGIATGANRDKNTWIIDNNKYPIADSVFSYDKDNDEFLPYTPDSKMKNQRVLSYISFFGRHVRAELKELNEEKLVEGYYVAVTNVYEEKIKDKTTLYVDLIDINGIDTYEVKGEISGDIKNKFVKVNFVDNKVTKIEVMKYNEQIVKISGNYLYNGTTSIGKITSNSILVKVLSQDDGYVIEFDKGLSAFDKFNNKAKYIVKDNKLRIEYVVVEDNNINSDSLEIGLVSAVDYDAINERYVVEFEGVNGRFFLKERIDGIREGALIAYITEIEDDLEVLNVREVARIEDILDQSNLYISKDMIDGGRRLVSGDTIIDLDDRNTWGDYNLNSYRFIEVEIEVENNELAFGLYEEVELNEIKFKENSIIATGKNEDIFVIYKLTNEAKELIDKK